jgi:hypothetical protein
MQKDDEDLNVGKEIVVDLAMFVDLDRCEAAFDEYLVTKQDFADLRTMLLSGQTPQSSALFDRVGDVAEKAEGEARFELAYAVMISAIAKIVDRGRPLRISIVADPSQGYDAIRTMMGGLFPLDAVFVVPPEDEPVNGPQRIMH